MDHLYLDCVAIPGSRFGSLENKKIFGWVRQTLARISLWTTHGPIHVDTATWPPGLRNKTYLTASAECLFGGGSIAAAAAAPAAARMAATIRPV